MAWVRDAKRIKIQQKRVRELRADRNGLAAAWNGRTIRQGEAVAIWDEDEEGQYIKRARHWQVTTWPEAVLRRCWEEMDGGRAQRSSGIGACTHGLEKLLAVSSAADSLIKSEVARLLDGVHEKTQHLMVARHPDCTPLVLKLGALAEKLVPIARYLVFDSIRKT